MIEIRPAQEEDLEQVFDIFYQHEEGGWIVGFATVMERGHTAYLAELFIRPEARSSGLGTALLHRVFPAPASDHVRFTVSSTDFRAVSLYIRAGLRPLWPNFLLRADVAAAERLPETGVEAIEAQMDDPELARWDAEISGRPRAVDRGYWVRVERGVPLWFRRGGDIVGHGYVRPGARSLWHQELTMVGPVGASTEDDSLACVSAAVCWASPRAQIICIDVPGPHSCLAPLLGARFRITYVETFLADGPLFDPRRYVGSGDWFL